MRSPVVVVLATALSCIGAGAHSSPSLVISGITLVDIASGRVDANMTVHVEGSRIVRVEKTTDTRAPAGAHVVDGRGQFLIPGLWDMHVHLSYARSSALPALVANGVTAVRDLGSDLAELDRWRTQIADNTVVGPTIVRAGPMLNGMEFNRYQLAVADEAEARAAVRTLQKVGVDFIKLHRRTSREAYSGIAAEAKRLALPFIGHVPMTVSPGEASDAGQASIEHTETLFEGTFAADQAGKDLTAAISQWRAAEASELFAKFVRNRTVVDPILIAQAHIVRSLEATQPDPRARYIAASARQEAEKMLGGVRADLEKFLLERRPLLGEYQKVTAMMNRAGVTLLAGTDLSVLHAPGFSLHDELALLVETGLTPTEALRAATINPARLFPGVEVGTIEAGKRADFVLLDGNPLSDIRNTQRIRAVVLGGRLLDRKALDQLLATAAELAKQN